VSSALRAQLFEQCPGLSRKRGLSPWKTSFALDVLDWTSIRPPRLTNGPRTGRYRTALGQNLHGGTSIARAAVADLMLKTLGMAEAIGQAVGVAY
jgi:hypothetical protein